MEKLFLQLLANLGMTSSNSVIEFERKDQRIYIGWIETKDHPIKELDELMYYIDISYTVLNDWVWDLEKSDSDEFEIDEFHIEEHGRLSLNEYASMYAYNHVEDWELLHV